MSDYFCFFVTEEPFRCFIPTDHLPHRGAADNGVVR